MLFTPQKYEIEDRPGEPFVSIGEIEGLLSRLRNPTPERVREVLDKSLSLQRLSLEETAVLLCADSPEAAAMIMDAAGRLKEQVYGERIVVFAPLYIGNLCTNNCSYCGFRTSNRDCVRTTLSDDKIRGEVRALEKTGQKRLILVYGEHPQYNAEYIARTARLVYSTQAGSDRINRVNINAAPFDVDGFRTIKDAGIGTYQIFQETYHELSYAGYHPSGRKADFNWRLTSLDRAIEAGIDDVGLGVLFGLSDWRFEVMALVRHTNHLEACFGTGPHTISVPRIQNASNLDRNRLNLVSDQDFIRLVAILRLAVPYTGLILTAREPKPLRDKLIHHGVSQIDAGTKLELGSYSEQNESQNLNREQFEVSDTRTLAQAVDELVEAGQIPSFCTACYRKGRTGEHFMEFSTKGFIKRFCTPNALFTFAEYLEDYASPESREKGWRLICEKLESTDPASGQSLSAMLKRIRNGERDLLL